MKTEGLVIAPENPQPPRVSVFEPVEGSKDRERTLSAIPDSSIRRQEEMKPAERSDEFERAYNAIVGNEKLETLVVKAIKGNFVNFSALTNIVTEICISLLDNEIDNIIRKFKETLRLKASYYFEKFSFTEQEKQFFLNDRRIIDGDQRKDIFNSIGVRDVVSFVRARKKLHEAEPRSIPAFYFENQLDFTHKIDLIEMLDGEEGVTVNLIQIKSHEYSGAEIEKYTQAHKDWVNGYTVDMSGYERNFSTEPADKATLDKFMKNVGELEDVFLDILSGDIPFSKDILFEKLGLGDRPNTEKIWILKQYLPALDEEVLKLERDGYLNEENTPLVQKAFDEIRDQLARVENQKKNLTGISEVYSICATGSKEVSKVKIFEARGDERKAVKVQR